MLGMRSLFVVMRKDQMLEPEGRDPTFHVIGAERQHPVEILWPMQTVLSRRWFLYGGTDAWVDL